MPMCKANRPDIYRFSGRAIASLLAIAVAACGTQAETPVQLTSASCSQTHSTVQGHLHATSPADVPVGGFPEMARWVTTSLDRPGAVMKPYLELRYVNPVSSLSQFADHLPYSGISSSGGQGQAWGTAAAEKDPAGSLIQYKCVEGVLVAGGVINGFDSPSQAVTYGGPQGALTYLFTGGILRAPSPWSEGGAGNLMMQGYFSRPYRSSADGVRGADGGFNVFLRKKRGDLEIINFVISTHRSYELTEDPQPQQDQTTNALHISTLVADGTQWVTRSPSSSVASGMRDTPTDAEAWPDFFRVNISYADLQRVLQAAGKDSKPEDWAVTSASVLYEFTGSNQQTLGFSVKGFELFQSTAPL